MKTNGRLTGDEAVSTVIGIILMVAITVALASTVYLYMSSGVEEAPRDIPTINFFADDAGKTLYVVSFNTKVDWDDINMTATDDTDTLYNHSHNGVMKVGDTIYFKDNGIVEGNIIIRFRHIPTNTLIGIYELHSVSK